MINHNFKKKFGQNFISDKNLLSAIVEDGQVDGDDVLEIGAGAGTLTSEISKKAKRVVSYEIDKDLECELLSLNLKNVKFVFDDVMKYDIAEIEKDFEGDYKIIANLPYYITTPIIFKFLNGSKRVQSMTLMVQKEVAERMVAKVGTKDYGVLSVMLGFFGRTFVTRIVDRKMFYPVPNVDSAVVRIEIDREKCQNLDTEKFFRFIQTCFSMRRKTLKNNLSKLSKPQKLALIDEQILSKRAEMLSLEQFENIFRIFFE